MTKPRNTKGLKPFKPGQSGNPGGRPKTPEDLREGRKLNQHELERVINKLLYLDKGQLQEVVRNPETPMLELIAASILAQAAQKGDQQRLEFVLQRMIGKVKDQLEVTTPTPFIVVRQSGDQVVMGAEVKKLEGNK